MDIYTLPNVKSIASRKQPHSTGRSSRCFLTTQRGGIAWLGGRRKREEIWGICIGMAGSLCYKAETNTTLQSNYTPIKMFKKKRILQKKIIKPQKEKKKKRTKKNYKINWKTRIKMVISTYLLIITLNVNRLLHSKTQSGRLHRKTNYNMLPVRDSLQGERHKQTENKQMEKDISW